MSCHLRIAGYLTIGTPQNTLAFSENQLWRKSPCRPDKIKQATPDAR
jgi:hypothetical protein